MTLKLIVPKLEDVPEALRELYEPDGDRFKLKVEGVEDNTALKKALDAERKNAADAEKQAKAWKALGKTPEEIAELVREAAKAEEEKLSRAGDWDKLRAQMNEKHAKEIKDLQDKLAAKDTAMERFLIDGEATKAIAAAKGVPELLLPHVQRQVRMVEENGAYSVRVVDGAGGPRVNGKGEPLAISDLVAEMRGSEVYGRAFEGSGQSGSGAQSSGGGPRGTIMPADLAKMPAAQRLAVARAQQAKR